MLPIPIDRGDKNRLFHILMALQEIADVRLCAISREWEDPPTIGPELHEVEIRFAGVPRSRILAKAARDVLVLRPFLMFRYDLSVVNAFVRAQIREFAPGVFWGFQASSSPFFRHAKAIGRVLDMVDSPSRYVAAMRADSRFAIAGRIQSLVQGRIVHFEKAAVTASHAVLVNSDADRDHLVRQHGLADRVWTLPNCVQTSLLAHQWVPRPDRSLSRILFVGNLAYAPNAVGVQFFVSAVMPLLRARGRNIEFHIVGKVPPALVDSLQGAPDVILRGFVPDLEAEYLRADLLVVPVPHAGGAQYKLLEAMAIGLPVVASPETAAATGMTSVREVIVAEEPADYVAAVERLLDDQVFAVQLSDRARDWIRGGHTWEAQQPLLARTIEVALSGSDVSVT